MSEKPPVRISYLFLLGILTVDVTSQVQGPTGDIGAPVPAGRRPCDARDRPILGPKPAKSCGPYPFRQIAKFLQSSKKMNRSVNVASKAASCFCKRAPIVNTWISRGKRDALIPRGPWIDTCLAKKATFEFPTCIFHFNQKCWVLRPWVYLECPYKICRQTKRCKNIKTLTPKEKALIRISQCRHTNHKTIRFHIWCPRSRRVLPRTVSLPQCCSCMTRVCYPLVA